MYTLIHRSSSHFKLFYVVHICETFLDSTCVCSVIRGVCEVHIWDTLSNSTYVYVKCEVLVGETTVKHYIEFYMPTMVRKLWSAHLRYPSELHMFTSTMKCTFAMPFLTPRAYVQSSGVCAKCTLEEPFRTPHAYVKCDALICETYSNSTCLRKLWSEHLRYPFELHMPT